MLKNELGIVMLLSAVFCFQDVDQISLQRLREVRASLPVNK